jgi:membrane-associated phospholipid phosphatase
MGLILNLFNEFGGYGPLILLFLSWYLLWDSHNLFFYYTLGFFLDNILNLVLKGIFQQPRPSEDLKKFQLALTHGKRFMFKNGMPHDIFGMPSGHSESSLYSTIFVYLALRDIKLLYVYLLISLTTMTQRVVFNYHTILQVIAGASVGLGFGYIMYNFVREKVKGKIEEKPDDNGPV